LCGVLFVVEFFPVFINVPAGLRFFPFQILFSTIGFFCFLLQKFFFFLPAPYFGKF